MPPFEILEGFPKGCGGDVLAMEWCPTMDLIALITSDSQILVHRVTWQRLFVISCVDEQPIRCLAWRPDGKQLAAGHADGSVTLYDVEDGEQLSRQREHPSPLCLFSWVEAAPVEGGGRESPYVCSMTSLFAPLPQLPKLATAQQLLMEEGAPQLDVPLHHLLFEAHAALGFDVAVTADTDARVHLSVHGRFSLGCLHLAELPALRFGGGGPPQLLAVQLASTLHALTVVLRTASETAVMLPDGTRQQHEAGLLLLSFRTGQLARSRQEIAALALSSMQASRDDPAASLLHLRRRRRRFRRRLLHLLYLLRLLHHLLQLLLDDPRACRLSAVRRPRPASLRRHRHRGARVARGRREPALQAGQVRCLPPLASPHAPPRGSSHPLLFFRSPFQAGGYAA